MRRLIAVAAGCSAASATVLQASGAFVVPAGVTSVTVSLWGGGGGASWLDYAPGVFGGGGAFVSGTLAVTPYETLTIVVGRGGTCSRGQGSADACLATSAAGGGGGACGGRSCAGGGLSSISRGSTVLAVAGGGGAALGKDCAATSIGGAGGGGSGYASASGGCGTATYFTGSGGTATAGGAGKSCTLYGSTSSSSAQGAFLAGGAGAGYGGGGGGGYFGGGAAATPRAAAGATTWAASPTPSLSRRAAQTIRPRARARPRTCPPWAWARREPLRAPCRAPSTNQTASVAWSSSIRRRHQAVHPST